VSPLKRSLRQNPLRYEERLGPSKLYLDDIEDLLSYLREAAEETRIEAIERIVEDMRKDRPSANIDDLKQEAGKMAESKFEVEFKAGEAVAEEAEDLRDSTPKELDDVSISCSHPAVAIVLSPGWARVLGLAAASDDDRTRNVVKDVAQFLRARRTVYVGGHRTRLAILTTFGLVPVALAFIYWRNRNDWNVASTIALTFVLVTGLIPIVADRWIMFRISGGVRIIPERRKDARLISSQTKRDILIAVLSAVVGSILGIAGTLITTAGAK
jgi:hypothetical protein